MIGGDCSVSVPAIGHVAGADLAVGHPQDAGARVHGPHGVLGRPGHRLVDEVGLGDQDEVRELDLVDEQIGDRALVVRGGLAVGCGQGSAGTQHRQELRGVDERDHRVDGRDVGQAGTVLEFPLEGRRHGHGLGDAGRFDDDLVVLAGARQVPDALDQVLAQGAANAAVGQLDEAVFAAGEVGAGGDEVGVDVYLGEVVDDHGQPAAGAVRQEIVQERGLAGAEEAGEDRHGSGGGMGHADTIL